MNSKLYQLAQRLHHLKEIKYPYPKPSTRHGAYEQRESYFWCGVKDPRNLDRCWEIKEQFLAEERMLLDFPPDKLEEKIEPLIQLKPHVIYHIAMDLPCLAEKCGFGISKLMTKARKEYARQRPQEAYMAGREYLDDALRDFAVPYLAKKDPLAAFFTANDYCSRTMTLRGMREDISEADISNRLSYLYVGWSQANPHLHRYFVTRTYFECWDNTVPGLRKIFGLDEIFMHKYRNRLTDFNDYNGIFGVVNNEYYPDRLPHEPCIFTAKKRQMICRDTYLEELAGWELLNLPNPTLNFIGLIAAESQSEKLRDEVISRLNKDSETGKWIIMSYWNNCKYHGE